MITKQLHGIIPIIFGGVFILTAAVAFNGCYIAEPVVQLNNIDVDGPIHQVPIRVTDNDMAGHLRVTPHIEFMPKRKLEGILQIQTDQGITNDFPQYDTTVNLQWTLPSYVAGVSFDCGLSKVVSLSAGGNYSEVNGKHFFEWDLGLGLCFEGENSGGRLEAGIQWEDIFYKATFDQYEVDHYFSGADSVKYLYSFGGSGTHSNANLYVDLTLNTRFFDSPVNGFIRIGYGETSLIDASMFTGQESENISQSVGFVSLTPGLYFDVDKWDRLLLGCQFISPTSLNSSNPGWLVSPVVQFDFTF